MTTILTLLHRQRSAPKRIPTIVGKLIVGIIGIIGIIGFPEDITLTIPHAHAEQIAVSRYVQRVLDRSDAGIAFAWQEKPATDFLMYLPSWTGEVLSTFLSFIDTKIRIVEQQRGILEQTACLRLDLFLIEAKLEQVRAELKKALDQGNGVAVLRLRQLAEFLSGSYALMLKGASDPAVEDTAFGVPRAFDPPDASLDGKACPFDSDYLPPGPSNARGEAYGCDDTALAVALARAPTGADAAPVRLTAGRELDAIKTMSGQILQYTRDAKKFLELRREIDALLGRSAPATPGIPGKIHAQKEGCTAPGDDPWPEGAARTELRGPFAPSPEKNELKLLNMFRELRRIQGAIRAIPGYVADFFSTVIGETAMKRYGGWFFGGFSADQGEKETGAYAAGSDPRLQIESAIAPLTDSVTKLSQLAHDMGTVGENGKESGKGLRSFVRDYAYFLRRSCIARPCNARLERVLKMVFKDECFPYTNGEFVNDDENNPRWKQCAKAACIHGLPGLPESELPGECRNIP